MQASACATTGGYSSINNTTEGEMMPRFGGFTELLHEQIRASQELPQLFVSGIQFGSTCE
jgi:hypothetical protein